MELVVDRERLRQGLAHVGRALVGRGAQALTPLVLLTADDGGLTLAATSRDLTIVTRIPCAPAASGAVALPARAFGEFVADLPGEAVRLDLAPGSAALRVRAGRDDVAIDTLVRGSPLDEFPDLPGAAGEEDAGGVAAVIDATALRDLVASTHFAVAAPGEGNPTQAGVQLAIEGRRLTLCATDGRRLAVRGAPLADARGGDVAIVVPARAMAEIMRAAEWRGEAVLSVSARRNQLLCRTETSAIWAQLIDGTFPDWRRIVPQRRATRTIVERVQLLELLKIAAHFAPDDGERVSLAITPGAVPRAAGTLAVSASGGELGEHTGRLDADVEGAPVALIFNGQYLQRALSAIATTRVALDTKGPSGAGVLRPVDDADHVQLIMPYHPPAYVP